MLLLQLVGDEVYRCCCGDITASHERTTKASIDADDEEGHYGGLLEDLLVEDDGWQRA